MGLTSPLPAGLAQECRKCSQILRAFVGQSHLWLRRTPDRSSPGRRSRQWPRQARTSCYGHQRDGSSLSRAQIPSDVLRSAHGFAILTLVKVRSASPIQTPRSPSPIRPASSSLLERAPASSLQGFPMVVRTSPSLRIALSPIDRLVRTLCHRHRRRRLRRTSWRRAHRVHHRPQQQVGRPILHERRLRCAAAVWVRDQYVYRRAQSPSAAICPSPSARSVAMPKGCARFPLHRPP
jgi:hypothetical protein